MTIRTVAETAAPKARSLSKNIGILLDKVMIYELCEFDAINEGCFGV